LVGRKSIVGYFWLRDVLIYEYALAGSLCFLRLAYTFAARVLSNRQRIRPFDLTHREHLDLRLPLIQIDCAGDTDNLSLERDGPPSSDPTGM